MGFSVRVAKGVRISASSRGIRTSVRSGPVSYSFGSSSRRRSSGSRSSYASNQRAVREAAKREEARELQQAFQRILDVHREDFPPATRPSVLPPPSVDERAIHKRHEHQHLHGISLFKRAERAAAKERAAVSAATEIAEQQATCAAEQQRAQAELDALWQRLLANDPQVTMEALSAAFEDNEAAAAPVNVEGAEVTMVMLAPSEDLVPERYPTRTDAGNLTLRKLPKADRASFYKQLVCGHVVATLRETFAVAPAINAARVVAVRASAPDAYGNVVPEALIAGRWERHSFDGVQWASADAVRIAVDTASELVANQKGATKVLAPVPLTKEPALAELLGAIDFGELVGG